MDYVISFLIVGFAIISFCLGMRMGWAMAVEKANLVFALTLQNLDTETKARVGMAMSRAARDLGAGKDPHA